VDRAGTALADAATVFGALEMQVVAYDPQQWRIAVTVETHLRAVDAEFHAVSPTITCRHYKSPNPPPAPGGINGANAEPEG